MLAMRMVVMVMGQRWMLTFCIRVFTDQDQINGKGPGHSG